MQCENISQHELTQIYTETSWNAVTEKFLKKQQQKTEF